MLLRGLLAGAPGSCGRMSGSRSGLGGTLQHPLREGTCQDWTPSHDMPWRGAQALESRRTPAAVHSASPVWWAGIVYPWQGSRMLGMERPSCLAESLAREG